jgi:hypothetical protein
MFDRGKFLILIIVALAIGAAGFSVWFRHHQGQKTLALWGPVHASRIRNAPEVRLILLAPRAAEDSLSLTDGQGKQWHAVRELGIGQETDFIHIRRALLVDEYFEWETQEAAPVNWRYALQFVDADAQMTTLLIDGDQSELFLVETGVRATLHRRMMPSIRTYLDKRWKE